MTDLPIRVVGEDKSRAALASAERNVRSLGKAAKESQASLGNFGPATSALGKLEGAAGLAVQGVAGLAAAMGVGVVAGFVGQVAGAAIQLGKLGASTLEMRGAFNSLAQSAGLSGDAVLQAMRKASDGMVLDTDLITSANKALMMGAADSAQELAAIMEVAKVRSDAVGMSVGEAFAALAEGIGKVSERQLYALGISIDMEEANAQYAASIGKTAEKLTEAERQQALYNAVVADSASMVADAVGLSGADKIDQAAVAWGNLKTAIAEAFSPAVVAGAEALTNVLNAVDTTAIQQSQRDLSGLAYAVNEAQIKVDLLGKSFFEGDYPTSRVDTYVEAIENLRAKTAEFNAEYAKMIAPEVDLMGGGGINMFSGLDTQLEQAKSSAAALSTAYEDAFANIADMASGMADKLLPDMGPQVFGMIDSWTLKYQEQFDILVSYGYTTEQAMKILGVTMQEDITHFRNLGDEAEQLGIALAEGVAWGAEQAAGSIASFVGYASSALASVMGWMGQIGRGGITQGRSTPGPGKGSIGGWGTGLPAYSPPRSGWGDNSTPKGGKSPLGDIVPMAGQNWGNIAPQIESLGGAAGRAASSVDGLSGSLEGMLQKIPGLFGKSEVTQEQLDGAAAGRPQNFADDYLRRLKDEVMNGKDWANVSAEEAAAALGLDGSTAAEEVYRQFEAAWANSSLFANPENLKFLNMEAVQAELDKQLASADGEKNLKALFGIGTDADVAAVASLGLEVQNGLSTWLAENGMDDAAAALAGQLGAGLQAGGDAMGGGITGGLSAWTSSKDGKSALEDAGKRIGEIISKAMVLTPPIDVPPPPTGDGRTPPPPGKAVGDMYWQGGYVSVHRDETLSLPRGTRIYNKRESERLGGNTTVTVNASVTSPIDINRLAYKVRDVLAQRGR